MLAANARPLGRLIGPVAVLVGCSAEDGQPGVTECFVPDLSCPEQHPHPSGPCEGALRCQYPDGEGVETWTYRCEDDQWTAEPTCTDGSCPAPPFAELCPEPFDGAIAGATVEIGPSSADPFRPFAAGEHVEIVIGPQGGAMAPYRLRIGEVDDPPECILIRVVLTSESETIRSSFTRLKLHCGESLTTFAAVPLELVCPDGGPIQLAVQVEVQGLSAAGVQLELGIRQCPG